ncbi:MAG TPA: HNH endonuclease, partial [Microbacteriaceae bacterium]|nr:HNH endonuclease [Microbacteriaceae bacterium]
MKAAEELLADPRTREQIAADGLVGLIRLAVDADPTVMHGSRRPAVRVLVTSAHLSARAGHGRLEGHTDPVPITTIDRHVCDTGTIALGFDDDGQCVNVGRNQRLFTERQRIGMAARDGGCMAPGCDRPPAWCEAHHINQWARDHGHTNIA